MQESSPVVVNKPFIMYSFPDAIREVMGGGRITRVEWEDIETYGVLKDGYLCIHLSGIFHQWLVSDGDLFATDWIFLPNENNE